MCIWVVDCLFHMEREIIMGRTEGILIFQLWKGHLGRPWRLVYGNTVLQMGLWIFIGLSITYSNAPWKKAKKMTLWTENERKQSDVFCLESNLPTQIRSDRETTALPYGATNDKGCWKIISSHQSCHIALILGWIMDLCGRRPCCDLGKSQIWNQAQNWTMKYVEDLSPTIK